MAAASHSPPSPTLIREEVAAFRLREVAHLRSLSAADRALATCANTHPLQDLAHAGEFALLLCGLKPAVLIAFPATGHPANSCKQEQEGCRVLADYVRAVWRKCESVRIQCIYWPLTSPHMPSLRGMWIASVAVGVDKDLLAPVLVESQGSGRITERALARALGYPSNLPEWDPDDDDSPVRYIQAAYTDAADGTLYTSFVARATERPVVEQHFAHCCCVLGDKLGVKLELHIQ
ncbi:hypothetical protein HDU86_002996 [Geranomyces michiganensis]|nr:hypothetical protein HDU86_002996 [Geranomyces michiganensis]